MTEQRRPYQRHRVLPAVIAGIVLFGLGFAGAERVLQFRTQPGSRDLDLYAAVVARVASGESYYAVLAQEMPARGYQVRPVFAWRLPTLSWLLASLPRTAGVGLLWAVSALTLWGWARVLRLRGGAVALVLIAPLWLLFSSAAVYMHEVWAGQLIALAIAYWMRGRDRASLIAFVLAALIREHSILALGLVAIAAWRENRSAKMWGVAIAAVAAVYSAHIVAVVHHTPTGGITKGWGGLPGWAFIVSATRAHVLLVAAPYWVSALVAAVCVPALWVWREGRLVAVVVSAYAALFCVGARPDTWYWGLLILPLMPLGCIALARDALSSRLARKTQESAAALLV